MARTTVTKRKTIVKYPGSLFFVDSVNQHVSIPANVTYQQNIISSFTVLTKVFLSTRTNPANGFLNIFSNNVAPNGNNMFLFVDNNTKKVTGVIATGASNQQLISTATLTPGWNTVGYSYVQGGNLSVFVNQTINTTAATLTAVATAQPGIIGSSSNVNTRLHGYMANFYVFSGEISQTQLDRFHLANVVPSLTQALSYTMNTGSGTTVFDQSGNTNNGTMVNGVSWSTVVPIITRTMRTNAGIATNRTTI